ncbi:4Fe-4S dicluster domain-containing protein [Chlorobium phaeovibrioides]|uniref:4Fe-4S dicluster domain-containing protein n=1 Tax=Chlorobium phaeovibrioides TaxID=1094 RepID=UPI00163A300F|nr:ferredoxin family protein [Chlorobium phaeovibrioides]
MLILDCFFGRCEKLSCEGCPFRPVRSLRRLLKSRRMEGFDDEQAEATLSEAPQIPLPLPQKAQEKTNEAPPPGQVEGKAPLKRKKRLLVPREDIPWYPTINPDLCNGCGDCKVLCKPGVFELGPPDPTGVQRPKLVVAHPYKCLVLCTRCVPICTSGAITLPPREEFEGFVEYLD